MDRNEIGGIHHILGASEAGYTCAAHQPAPRSASLGTSGCQIGAYQKFGSDFCVLKNRVADMLQRHTDDGATPDENHLTRPSFPLYFPEWQNGRRRCQRLT